MLAVKHRRAVIVAAVFLSVTLGLGTVFINTHWLSDVVGGWLAGGLVLIVLPWLMPYMEKATAALLARVARARLRRSVRVGAGPTEPSPVPNPRRTVPVFSETIVPPAGVAARTRVPAYASRRQSPAPDAD
jgi:undecaprenyl-diphosphatase